MTEITISGITAVALTLRPTYPGTDKEHYSVHSGDVHLGTIYRRRTQPEEWFWGIHGVLHGPLVFNGRAMTREDAKRQMDDGWRRWLAAAHLAELEAPLVDSDTPPAAPPHPAM
jgi:hypothetical protein